MSQDAVRAAYDALPYSDFAFAYTHPDQLAVTGALFGLTVAPVTACRILELGCAVGGNLLPMAAGLPGSRCVGVDLSPVQIAAAEAARVELGLYNVTFREGDATALPEDLGEFDYIICHGLYSWVSDTVAAGLLASIRRHLAPNGVAYVSYNTYPGWKLIEPLRDLMRLHTAPFEDPAAKIEQALAISDWLGSYVGEVEADPRRHLFATELANIHNQPPSYVLHEYLSDAHRPRYFREFVAEAQTQGLKYVGDARPWGMWLGNYPNAVRGVLEAIPGLVQQQQYLDFVTSRRFRMSLLTRDDAALSRSIDNELIETLCLGAGFPADPGEDGLAEGAEVAVGPVGRRMNVGGVAARMMLSVLWSQGRRTAPFGDVFERVLAGLDARGLLPDMTTNEVARAELRRDLRKKVLRLFFGEVVTLSPRAAPVAKAVDARPWSPPLQRWQAGRGEHVTTLLHEHIRLPTLERTILRQCDGTRDRLALAALDHGDADLDAVLAGLWRRGLFGERG